MICESRNELLADHSGRAEYANVDLSRHNASSYDRYDG